MVSKFISDSGGMATTSLHWAREGLCSHPHHPYDPEVAGRKFTLSCNLQNVASLALRHVLFLDEHGRKKLLFLYIC